MRRLDVNEAGDFTKSCKHFQSIGMHPRVARTECEIGVNLLKSSERMVQNRDRSFNDGAVTETVNVSHVNNVHSFTRFGARTIANDALAIHSLKKTTVNCVFYCVVLLFNTFFFGGQVRTQVPLSLSQCSGQGLTQVAP